MTYILLREEVKVIYGAEDDLSPVHVQSGQVISSLKIKAFYLNTDPKCFQANRTIRLRELKIDNKMQDSKRADDLTPNETRKQTTMSLLNMM